MEMFIFGVVIGAVATAVSIIALKQFKEFEDNYNDLVDNYNNLQEYIDSQKEEIVRLKNIIDNK